MAWTCYSCGTKNANKEDTCSNCNGNVAAPRSFYTHWIFGGAMFFLVTYIIGVFVGGTLVEVMAAPSPEAILAEAKAADAEAKSLDTIKPEALKAAKAAAVDKAKTEISPFLRYLVYWILPIILFFVCGGIVGFVSDGKTIIEAAIASVVGQAGGFLLLFYVIGSSVTWMSLIIGVAPGFGLAMAGAYFGEILQDRRERAV